ncbi:unnamed protein product [Blumeria hordei]|uniref:Peroxisomal membrane protein 4 n=2 Tax=Blumeria hordei TaxID=2867405 RepID=A0A383UZW6_BLUHO|nr:unnamed protein product [Blumeria hordei]
MSRTGALKLMLEEIILNPENAELLAILKAARNGAVYGAKVRFPHALVMTFLFRSGTLREKVDAIFAATRSHALVLARYAAVYKLAMFCLKYMGSDVGKEGTYDTFIAGLIGGYLIFGRRSSRGRISPVSKQIVIFVFARALLSLAQISVDPSQGIIKNNQLSKQISHGAWPLFAAISWGSIMWLFRWYPHTVQSGLRSSMDYIYVQSDQWDSLRNFLIYNK